LASYHLTADWLGAATAVSVAPLVLSVGALRYRLSVQLWATGCLLVGIGSLAVVLGIERFNVASGGPGSGVDLAPLFGPPANAIRLMILILTGMTTAYVMVRANGLLLRAGAEATQRANLARFLPSEVAPLIAQGSGDWRSGRRQRVAIVFVDLRGSTALAEDMDPAQLSVFISAFRRRIMRATTDHGGMIDKFIGDGALIVFGVPEPREDDTTRAFLCGCEILRLVERWNLKRGFDPPIRVGIGIHAGEAFCGVLGDEERLEFTILGDAVNVAARIEQATKQFGAPLLVSEAVVQEALCDAGWREVAREPLRGRSVPVGIFAPGELLPVDESQQAG
jgi:adenylate cyclase